MMRDMEKEWCCLIYANGHNELAPETYAMIQQLINCSLNESVHIVIQMAYECNEAIELMRGTRYAEAMEKYCGRYSIKQNGLCIEEIFDSVNMADPKSLEDFITWGSYHFPAKKYMLLMGGHVYQFVGLSPDYSEQMPYLLSFCDMAKSINKACQKNKIEIELLILDTCYCSTIEILTELCNSDNQVVKHLLTYFGSGPLRGMQYNQIIENLIKPNQTTISGLRQLIELNHSDSTYQLVGIVLDESIISLYKKLFNMIAIYYYKWSEVTKQTLTPYEILACNQPNVPWKKFSIMIEQISMRILIKDEVEPTKSLPIHVLYQCIPDDTRRSLYSKFHFAKRNKWFYLLCGFERTQYNPYQNQTFEYEPVPVPKELLKMFIDSTNYYNDSKVNEEIVQKLIDFKGWDI